MIGYRKLHLALALATLNCVAQASPPDFDSPESYVQSLPSASIESAAKGDLNGDGYDDWVISVVTPNGDYANSRRLVVLLHGASGRYLPSASSRLQGVDPDNGTSTNEFELEVGKGSFFVNRSNRWHGCGTRDRFQFRLSTRGWQLIGASTYDGRIEGEGEGIIVSRDLNLLTGTEVLSVSGHAEIRKKFQRQLFLLEDYPIGRDQLFRIPYKGRSPCA